MGGHRLICESSKRFTACTYHGHGKAINCPTFSYKGYTCPLFCLQYVTTISSNKQTKKVCNYYAGLGMSKLRENFSLMVIIIKFESDRFVFIRCALGFVCSVHECYSGASKNLKVYQTNTKFIGPKFDSNGH